MRFIVVTGTPGTGKTVIGSRVSRFLGCRFTTLSWLVLEKGLWLDYDYETRSFTIDWDGLVSVLRELPGKGCIVLDTHWLEPVREAVGSIVDRVVLLRTDPRVLARRLARRCWPPRKVAENVEAELVGVLAGEAVRVFGEERVYEIDTSSGPVDAKVREALNAIRKGLARCCIDWIERLGADGVGEVVRLVERGVSVEGC